MHVVIKLKNGEEIFGRMAIKNENSIDLDDAMRMRYHISEETDSPVMYFTKYCIFNQSFNVTIPNDCIMHIFKDPVESLIEFYERELEECKLQYEVPTKKKTITGKRGKKDEIIFAMFEKLKGDHEVH